MSDQDDNDLATYRELCAAVDVLEARHEGTLERFTEAAYSGTTSVNELHIVKEELNTSAAAVRAAKALADEASPPMIDFASSAAERRYPGPLIVDNKVTKH